MAFLFKSIIDTAANYVGLNVDPFQVLEVNASLYNGSSCNVIATGDRNIELYKTVKKQLLFEAVIAKPNQDKVFSLFRVQTEREGRSLFDEYHPRLAILCQSTRRLYDRELMQKACDIMREHSTWTAAHIAAKLGLKQCLKNKDILKDLDTQDKSAGLTPIHLAIESASVECVKEFMINNPDLDSVDNKGNNVFHFVASVNNTEMFKLLISRTNLLNQSNCTGETPLHVAAKLNESHELIDQFLIHGANPTNKDASKAPIHYAIKEGNMKAVELLVKRHPTQIEARDQKYGGAPLHWARVKEAVHLLAEMGADVNARSHAGDTPLHVTIKKKRFDCVVTLLTWEVDVNIVGEGGNTALHLAVQNDDLTIVKAIIAFGADLNVRNADGHTARHITATGTGMNKRAAIYTLHMAGAERCANGVEYCTERCSCDGNDNGTVKTELCFEELDTLYDSLLSSLIERKGIPHCGMKLLSLDGGGIRGLVLIQMLAAIELYTGQKIYDMFDWIAGTSTGGILALGLAHGKSVRYILGLYFRLKNAVFCGKRPYSSEALETFLIKEFGEHLTMADLRHPKVMVTGVLGDRHPGELHLFRNYEPPRIELTGNSNKARPSFKPTPAHQEQLVWRAARSTGAAPTYFRANGRFLDGGLIANNPTMDAITEIHEYNLALQAEGQEDRVRPLGLVVSLGTGKIPVTEVQSIDVFMPTGVRDFYQVAAGIPALGNLLVDACTQADGRVVERTKAWCSMIQVPYFRLSPPMTTEVPLDTNDDSILLNMMWETACYIHHKKDTFQQLARILLYKEP